jgi:hypothetical protein
MRKYKWEMIPWQVSHVEWNGDEACTSDVVLDTVEVINQMLEGVDIKVYYQKSVDSNAVYIFVEAKVETKKEAQ